MTENIEQAIRVLGEAYSRSQDVNEASEFLVKQGDKAVLSLIEALNSDNGYIMLHAIFILGEMRAEQATIPLIELAEKTPDARDGEEYDLKKNILDALGEIGDTKAIEALIQYLSHPEEHYRVSAAEALKEIGDPQSVEALIGCLNDPSWNVRCAAANALGDIGDPRAIEHLKPLLKERHVPKHTNVSLAGVAAWALENIGHRK